MTLKHRIGNRPMDTELIGSLGIEIADVLAAAHAENILHLIGRSLNPTQTEPNLETLTENSNVF